VAEYLEDEGRDVLGFVVDECEHPEPVAVVAEVSISVTRRARIYSGIDVLPSPRKDAAGIGDVDQLIQASAKAPDSGWDSAKGPPLSRRLRSWSDRAKGAAVCE
jgi:hypothetical protein